MPSFKIALKHGNRLSFPKSDARKADGQLLISYMLLKGWKPDWDSIDVNSDAAKMLQKLGLEHPELKALNDTSSIKLTSECRTVNIAKRFLDDLYENEGASSVFLAIEGETRKTVIKHADKVVKRILSKDGMPTSPNLSADENWLNTANEQDVFIEFE